MTLTAVAPVLFAVGTLIHVYAVQAAPTHRARVIAYRIGMAVYWLTGLAALVLFAVGVARLVDVLTRDPAGHSRSAIGDAFLNMGLRAIMLVVMVFVIDLFRLYRPRSSED